MDTPKIYDSLLPVFTLFFISTYILGHSIIFRKWDNKHRSEASSCLMSLAHGTPALLLSISSIQNHNPTSPNTPFQNTVLEYSIAYFTMDLLHYIIMVPTDALFVAHHLATLYVLLTCRYLFQHGAVAVLGVLALAESTTTCQNTWSLARFRKHDSDKAKSVFELLSPVFYGCYSVVRGVVGPVFVYNMGLVLGRGLDLEGVMPRWGWISWMVVIAVGIGVSMLWVVHLWIDLYRQRCSNEQKKLK